MPTGKITFAGGVSAQSIQVPHIPRPPAGVRGSTITYNDGHDIKHPIPPQPNIDPGYGTHLTDFYARMVPEIAKANFLAPSNQGRRLQGVYQAGQMPESGNNTPSRSQFSEGYTDAIQVFAASNTWQLAGPTDSPGTRIKQPSQKFVSPFSSLPIPVKMPWDL